MNKPNPVQKSATVRFFSTLAGLPTAAELLTVATIMTTLALTGCSTPEICEKEITWSPGTPQVEISKNDKILICGDPAHYAWKKIPPGQSAKFLRSYLESQAYLDPKITVDYDAGKVVVDAGKRSVVTAILTEGEPPEWKTPPLNIYLGHPLEKTTLDTISSYSIEQLKTIGYACGKIDLVAHPDGRVILKIQSGERQIFPQTVDVNPPEVDNEILRRYEPFHEGNRFNISKTILAGWRMESDNVVSSAQYTPRCENGKLTQLDRSASFGSRRAWEIGVGASTEEYPLGFVRWNNSRLWSSASTFRAEFIGSNIRQKISGDLKWYAFKDDRRMYLKPGAQFEHRKEPKFESIETKITSFLGRTFDIGNWTLDPQAGFNFRRFRDLTARPSVANYFFTPGILLNAHSHDFERYRGSPRTGVDFNFAYDFLPGSQAKTNSVHRTLISGTALWNFRDYVEPRWVLGARYSLGMLVTGDGSIPNVDRVPVDWFFLIGGDRDLRGFGRNSLPEVKKGAGSAATLGIESRWPNLFPMPLEPLLFTDYGWLGHGNMTFDPGLFYSPGLGARAATPLGTIRATYANGYNPLKGHHKNQYFVSFGAEF
ncbi:MAG: BamA/TamA family outer membrane protein [Cryobacterium sp.]|nr:BamA/TamA family outer membrane protein [Oligoflexia bacterium]